MKLSEFSFVATVVRDAEFLRLGSFNTQCNGLLAYADNLKYLLKAISNSSITCIITTSKLSALVPEHIGLMVASIPREAFYAIHIQFINDFRYTLPFDPDIGKGCKIHPTAQIAVGCKIGDNVNIGENVVVRSPVWIGSNVTIEPGVKLGVEGILFLRTNLGPKLLPHGGYVHIHDHVILMTNSVVVRSVHDSDVTEIHESALIGLSTIIGHEAKIGKRAVISNQCTIARKSVVGSDAFLGTQTMVKENTFIGNGAKVMAGSIVISDVPAGATVSGNFAIDHKIRMLEFARLSRRQIGKL